MAVKDIRMEQMIKALGRALTAKKDSPPKEQHWNSLEITKILVALLTPIAIAVATYQYNAHKDVEVQQQERLRRVVAKRVDLWDQIAPKMNDIYCYFLYVGRWKEFGPKDILDRKRDLDALMYANQILFSQDFFKAYEQFMTAGFEMYRGWGKDAAFRTRRIRPKDVEMPEDGFTGNDNGDEVHKAYWNFQDKAAIELYVPVLPTPPRPTKPDEKQVSGLAGSLGKISQASPPPKFGMLTAERTFYDMPANRDDSPRARQLLADLQAPGDIEDVTFSCRGECGWLHQVSLTKNGHTAHWIAERVSFGVVQITFAIRYRK